MQQPTTTLSLLAASLFLAACGTIPITKNDPPDTIDGPLTFVDELGTRHDLDALLAKGEPVTLVFWQTWCASCRAEGPALARAAREFAGKMHFYGVISGPDVQSTEIEKIASLLDLPYPQVRDKTGDLAERLRVDGVPMIIVLGKDRAPLYRGRDLPKTWAAFLGG